MRPSALVAVAAFVLAATAEAQDAGIPDRAPSSYSQLSAVTWVILNTAERREVRLYREDGTVDPAAHRVLTRLLRDHRRDRETPIDARLLRLVYRIAYHFGASTVRVISGFRARTSRRHSHHRDGTALDFRLDGIETAEVARYARYLSRVGVGHYSTSEFVHLDVRDASYYWRNRSGPGRHGWNRALARVGARERDVAWTERADEPWDPPGFVLPSPDPTDEPIATRPARRHRGRERARGPRRRARPRPRSRPR